MARRQAQQEGKRGAASRRSTYMHSTLSLGLSGFVHSSKANQASLSLPPSTRHSLSLSHKQSGCKYSHTTRVI